MKIDIHSWKAFALEDLFNIERGDRIIYNEDFFDMKNTEYCYPVITAKTENNGVAGYYNKSNCSGNCIISCGEASGMFTSYQEKPCWALDTVRVYSFKSKSYQMNMEIGLFLATLLSANMFRFSYGRKAKPSNMYPLKIKLPITASGEPDWKYIRTFIGSLHHDRITTKITLERRFGFDVSRWEEFRFGDLLDEIYKAKAYNKDELITVRCSTPNRLHYITRTDANNGCEAFVVNPQTKDVEKGNAITIGDTTATVFYQDEDFICGDHMVVLRAKWLNKYTGLFICSVLKQEKYKYCYGRAYTMDKIEDTMIKLPIRNNGYPDYDYMETLIKSLPYSDRTH